MATEDNRQDPPQQDGLAPGSVVGGTWVVERLLGKGGMGAVWLARHRLLQQKCCAIKVLLGAGLTDEAYRRFTREAEIATRIGHPNIVDVLDMATLPTGEPYIVLEYLQGETLRQRLQRCGRLPFAEVAEIARQIGSALVAAHRQDVVHRDLKPENVFLVPTDSGGVVRDHVKVLDFGISKLRGSQSLQTRESAVLGTPQYMAPEQAQGHNSELDARTDQFALAVMVYELLTGRPPWTADTPLGVLFQVVHAPTPQVALELPELPPQAVAALERALRKDAAQRYASIGEFIQELTGAPLRTLQRQFAARGAAADAESGADTVDADSVVGDAVTPGSDTLDAGEAVPSTDATTDADTVGPPTAVGPARATWLRWVVALALAGVAGVVVWSATQPASSPPPVAPSAVTALAASPVLAPASSVPAQPAVPPPSPATPAAVEAATQATPSAPVPTAPAAVAPATRPATSPGPVVAAAKAASRKGTVESADPVPAEVVQAEAALAAGRLAEAERLAEHSLLEARTSRAFAVLAKARCARGDLGGARTWFGQLRGAGIRAAVKSACARDGVTW